MIKITSPVTEVVASDYIIFIGKEDHVKTC